MQNPVRLILVLIACVWATDAGAQKTSQMDLFTANVDGTDPRMLTSSPESEREPAWSPDGKRIAFNAGHDSQDIFVINADGTGVVNLTDSKDRSESAPAWSPDGSTLAFSGALIGGKKSHIYIKSLDGTEEMQLTTGEPRDHSPDWSSDGTGVVFSRFRGEYSDICIVDVRSGDTSLVTSNESTGFHSAQPAWSPDGKMIAYVLMKSRGEENVHVIDLQDGRDWNITINRSHVSNPAWSPNGRKIAFNGIDEFGSRTLYVANFDGTDLREIFDPSDEHTDRHPDWSPDGKRLVFVRNYRLAAPRQPEPSAVVIYEDGGMRLEPQPTDRPPWSYATKAADGTYVYREITLDEAKDIMRRLGMKEAEFGGRAP